MTRALNEQGKSVNGAHVLALGVAYKKDIEDWRESPALKIIELLERDGARLDYHDPHVPSFQASDGKLRHSVPLTKEELERTDCAVILTDHSRVDWGLVVAHASKVVDTRNATKDVRADCHNVSLL